MSHLVAHSKFSMKATALSRKQNPRYTKFSRLVQSIELHVQGRGSYTHLSRFRQAVHGSRLAQISNLNYNVFVNGTVDENNLPAEAEKLTE